MKTLAQKIHLFASSVETLSDYKTEYSRRGQEIYREYQEICKQQELELRQQGVTEESSLIFKNAMIKYKYWK